jgi:hypothetical protein
MYVFRLQVPLTFDCNTFCVKMTNITDSSSYWILHRKLSSYNKAIGPVCKAQLVIVLVVVLQCAYCRLIFLFCFTDVGFSAVSPVSSSVI